jgi:hypothetical protein
MNVAASTRFAVPEGTVRTVPLKPSTSQRLKNV